MHEPVAHPTAALLAKNVTKLYSWCLAASERPQSSCAGTVQMCICHTTYRTTWQEALITSETVIVLALQVGSGKNIQALLGVKVALLSAIAGSIAVASCVLNDFFDYSVDVINEPSKVSHCHAHTRPCAMSDFSSVLACTYRC